MGCGGGCRCRPWVPTRGGHRVRRGRDVWANPHRPGHSSHATGRILKAPVPRPAAPQDSPGPPRPPSPPQTRRVPYGRARAPRPGARSPGHPRCREPRGQRERGKTAPGSAARAGRGAPGDSAPAGLRGHAGDERGTPSEGPERSRTSRGPCPSRRRCARQSRAAATGSAPVAPSSGRGTTSQLHRVPVGTWAAGQPRGGHGPGCPGPVKDCPGSREKPPCPLSPLSPGDRATRARGEVGLARGRGCSQRERGHVGGDVRCPKGGSGRVCSPQSRSPRGDRPGPALQGGQGGPARSQNLSPPPASLFPAQPPRGGR